MVVTVTLFLGTWWSFQQFMKSKGAASKQVSGLAHAGVANSDSVSEISLMDVVSYSSSISTQHPIRIKTMEGEVLTRPGVTNLIALGQAVRSLQFG
jgi:hypothetical protein